MISDLAVGQRKTYGGFRAGGRLASDRRPTAGLRSRGPGNRDFAMFRRRPPSRSLPLLWIVVGVIVAAIYDYFDSLGTAGRVLTAAAAVLLWPILLFGFDIRISR